MVASLPSYEGLDQNYDFIYEALLEGATVYLRIANCFGDGLTANVLVTSWLLDPSYGLVLEAIIDGSTQVFEFTNGSYHSSGR